MVSRPQLIIVESHIRQLHDLLQKLRPHRQTDFSARTGSYDKYCLRPEHCPSLVSLMIAIANTPLMTV